ncbi:thiamine-phosphate pyrophosphorylase [Paenibacillus swuensis]|uniref:Thiamine-phosphate synthase n=1 Tax=Paenibacillus swuensis TaxID=1178515 RepID=A0A172THI7_9BACL|nr:thiamine phosphate synthase [Paenibacillus swuensis]ANE46327.1 thiamine-phosphate pyrophosphorylase [Paenibacillus swuensis]
MSRALPPAAVRRMLPLYFVAGTGNTGGELALLRTLAAALEGGISAFQLREKGPGALLGRARFALALGLREQCRRRGVPFIVNDDVELALAVEADGVHVGQEDAPAAEVRRRLGARLLGVSVHTVDEARRAAAAGADYIGCGPMYATASKPDARAVAGPALVRQLRAAGITLPLVGIGGITSENAASVTAAGADGVAVISAISGASDPRAAAVLLKQAAMSINS